MFSERLLERLQQEGLLIRQWTRQDPYTARVEALSPEGFGVTIEMHKQDTSDIVEDLVGLLSWLREQGFQPVGSDKPY